MEKVPTSHAGCEHHTAPSQLSIRLIVTGSLQVGISNGPVLSVYLNMLIFILSGMSQVVPASVVTALCRVSCQ